MKKLLFAIIVLASVSMSSNVMAQRGGGEGGQRGQRGGQRGGGERGGPGGQRGERPVSPLMTALDADKDGKLSAEEIKNAAVALKALDKNEDGVLDATEMAPARPERGGRGGGPGGAGGAGDPSAMVDRIMQRDTDGDGTISKEEAGDRMGQLFGQFDTDSDGKLTKAEVEAMAKQFGGGRGGRGAGGGGRGGRGGGGGGGGGGQSDSKSNRPGFDDK